jgi:hypothetical protein
MNIGQELCGADFTHYREGEYDQFYHHGYGIMIVLLDDSLIEITVNNIDNHTLEQFYNKFINDNCSGIDLVNWIDWYTRYGMKEVYCFDLSNRSDVNDDFIFNDFCREVDEVYRIDLTNTNITDVGLEHLFEMHPEMEYVRAASTFATHDMSELFKELDI